MTNDLPGELGAAFGVTEARMRGVSAARLRRRDLGRPFRAARCVVGATLVPDAVEDAARTYPRTPQEQHMLERAVQYVPVMSSAAFFSGVTAAVAWGAPLPPGVLVDDPDPALVAAHRVADTAVVDVSVFWPDRAPRGSGVCGHALRPKMTTVHVHPRSGLRLTSPETTWAMLAGMLWHPYDLVAMADFFVHTARPPRSRPWQRVDAPLTTVELLEAAVGAGRRVGIARLREALPRVRMQSASRPETWTRLTLVDGGLPEPELDHDVFDADGRFVACVDLAYPRYRIAIEYEGAHHNTAAHWELDVERYARLEAAGWRVIRVTKTMLFQRPEVVVARVRAALAAGRR